MSCPDRCLWHVLRPWHLALALAVVVALQPWALLAPQRYHCGCCAVVCNLPCLDCCDGASPSGCPLPGAIGYAPDPEPELVLPERAR